MPWDVRRAKSGWDVVNSETGRVVGHHSTQTEAEQQQRALYTNVQESRKSDEAYDLSSEPPADRNSAYDIASIAYSAPNGITNVDTINRYKQIINGSNSNRKKKKAEDGEMPIHNTWQGQFLPRRG